MSSAVENSPRELSAAYEQGSLARDDFWLRMREQHQLLEQYTARDAASEGLSRTSQEELERLVGVNLAVLTREAEAQ
jgi:hypothetical protein